jgi:hypothetical protein
MGEMGKEYTISVRISEQERPLKKYIRGWEDNIKMNLTKIGRCFK